MTAFTVGNFYKTNSSLTFYKKNNKNVDIRGCRMFYLNSNQLLLFLGFSFNRYTEDQNAELWNEYYFLHENEIIAFCFAKGSLYDMYKDIDHDFVEYKV